MDRTVLLIIYLAAFALEIVGIVFTVKDVFRLINNSDGTFSPIKPEGWRAARGPLFIGLGAAVGAAGSIASLLLNG